MIDLNLMKQKPLVRGIPSEKNGILLLAVVMAFVFFGALVTVGVLQVVSGLQKHTTPSTYVNTPSQKGPSQSPVDRGMLIDSVTGSVIPKTVLSDYSGMSFMEQQNYGHRFAYIFFRELSIITPKSLDFQSIKVADLSSFVAVGGVDNKKDVVALFTSLKNIDDGWRLHPKPETIIRSLGSSYQFRVAGNFNIPLKKTDSNTLTKDVIQNVDHLQEQKNAIMNVVKGTPVVLRGSLEILDTKFTGEYRQYLYTLKGRSNFTEFRDMLYKLYLQKAATSFTAIDVYAQNGGVEWSIDIMLTLVAK